MSFNHRSQTASGKTAGTANRKLTPTDPLYGDQWHLGAIGEIETIWDDFRGLGVTVAVYDDGIEYGHPDLDDNIDTGAEVVINGTTIPGDPQSNRYDIHGTAVAGIIAAEANGSGPVGVAYDATLVGVNLYSNEGNQYDVEIIEAMAAFDITNNSWGYDPLYFLNFNTDSDSIAMEAGLKTAVDTGRDEKGTIVVKAGGNEWDGYYDYLGNYGDRGDVNASNFNSTRYTIVVGAIDDTGTVSSYSNRGAALLLGAPSDGGTLGITTTDRTGRRGYDNGDTTDVFGGTSAATPIVSGVVALMLEANPALGWRDVQSILAIAADHTGSVLGASPAGNEAYGWTINGALTWNGGGYHFSNDYGFGQVNAYASTRIAEIWSLFGAAQTSANEQKDSDSASVNETIEHGSDVVFDFSISGSFIIEYVDLTLDFWHRDMEDLTILLTSPAGTISELQTEGAAGLGAVADDGIIWTYGSNAFRGEQSDGTWTVTVEDHDRKRDGFLNDANLEIYGAAANNNNVYHYTDDVFKALSWDAGRQTLEDGNGGTDWINAAAMTNDLSLDLEAGTGSVGTDQFLTISGGGIENIVAGDGNDTLIGDGGRNHLYGMRGDDSLVGGDHHDRLVGDTGEDELYGQRGKDRLEGGKDDDNLDGGRGHDRLYGGSRHDVLIGGYGNDQLFGGKGHDRLYGGEHNDLLIGGYGNDNMYGGPGNDVFLFSKNWGLDTIFDFEGGIDEINIAKVNVQSTDFNVFDDDGNAVVDFGGAHTITFIGRAGLISVADFNFY